MAHAFHDLGVALVGTGFMGPVHTQGLRSAGIQPRGVLGSSKAASRRAADTWQLPRAYASWQELLGDTSVDSVHILTPNHLHHAMAREALEAGRHVLCEKPLAVSPEESRDLAELADRRSNQVAGVNYNIRFYPLCIEARERILEGELGDIVHVGGSYVQDWLLWPTDFNWRVRRETSGPLRAAADIGSHWFDLVGFLTGLPITRVCGQLHTVHDQRMAPPAGAATFGGGGEQADLQPVDIDTDDYAAVLFRLAGEVPGCAWFSQVTAGRKNCLRFEVAGTKASLAWNSERPNELWLGDRNGPNQLLLRDPALLRPNAAAACTLPGGHNEGYADSFRACFESFYSRICGDASPVPFATFADGHRQLALGHAILQSSNDGQWVQVPEGTP